MGIQPKVSILYAVCRPSQRCRRLRTSSWQAIVQKPFRARAVPMAGVCGSAVASMYRAVGVMQGIPVERIRKAHRHAQSAGAVKKEQERDTGPCAANKSVLSVDALTFIAGPSQSTCQGPLRRCVTYEFRNMVEHMTRTGLYLTKSQNPHCPSPGWW